MNVFLIHSLLEMSDLNLGCIPKFLPFIGDVYKNNLSCFLNNFK